MVFKRTTKNRVFYLRMKLPLRHLRHDKSFCYRYFRCVIWFSLSLYFFSSYLISNSSKTTPLLKTTVSTSLTSFVSRPLFETNMTVLQRPRSQNPLLSREVVIHKALLSSEVRTLNPWEADFFFVASIFAGSDQDQWQSLAS
ncbi:hypothetical protein NE237_025412 [Protea cynaroides]|uniref:Uncharacterized protein n=1 Tax=Protea cynaroides TaxID=273540 RepID=A0A9Q0H462_9MAGN|nr:hypothetical protein NE237_025412 [Protea cynaroides]